LLISNLEKQDIEKNQIIVDPFDIKALANLQESLVISNKLESLELSLELSISVNVIFKTTFSLNSALEF
jgi:hypothetical protein